MMARWERICERGTTFKLTSHSQRAMMKSRLSCPTLSGCGSLKLDVLTKQYAWPAA
jgi:hypothetical protein